MKTKQQQLKQHGLGNRPKATMALTDDEIEILFNKSLLGLTSPQALLNTSWLNKKNSAGETSFSKLTVTLKNISGIHGIDGRE